VAAWTRLFYTAGPVHLECLAQTSHPQLDGKHILPLKLATEVQL
jgi:hypothetical protein